MITIPSVKGEKYAVFGLGLTGIASADALVHSGAEVYSWDEKPSVREKTQNTEYRASHPKEWPWDALAGLVLSPGVPLTHPEPHIVVKKARAHKVPVIGDGELFARAVSAFKGDQPPAVVAITGSNGKSTTTALIAQILRETGHRVHEGGNIGAPILALPDLEEHIVYVLELSSFQLDLIDSLKPTISVFLNISPDHLDRHGSMEGYVAAKRRIFARQGAGDHAIIGVDDEISQSVCTEMTARGAMTVTPISATGTLGNGVFALGGGLFHNLEHKTSRDGDIPKVPALRGQHNHQNAAAALATVMRLGVSPPVAVLAMGKFKGLPHRMEQVGRFGHVIFINDSKATNADAVARAISCFDAVHWIAGGQPKDGGIADVLACLDRVRKAYLYGEAADLFQSQINGRVPVSLHTTMAEATDRAFQNAYAETVKEGVVLLSPAAASFDQFLNFEDRGNQFRDHVEKLIESKGAAA